MAKTSQLFERFILLLLSLYSIEGKRLNQTDGCHILASEQNRDIHAVTTTLRDLFFSSNGPPEEDVVVCLRNDFVYSTGGRPFVLGKEHVHPIPGKRVIWRTVDRDGNRAVVQAATPVERWYRCDDGVRCPWTNWHGVYVAYVSDIKNISTDYLPIRTMWMNGTRVGRVTTDVDQLNWTNTQTGYVASSPLPPGFASSRVELLWPKSIRNWIEPRCVVTAVNGTDITVDPACWKSLIARNGGKLPGPPASIENAPFGPPEAGQFLSTTEYLFYRPPASDPYQVPTNVFVPNQEQIMIAENLSNHVFEGIAFRGGSWFVATEPGGYVPSQTLVSTKGEPPAGVSFRRVENVTVRDCSFEHVGSAYALGVENRSKGVDILDNIFRDLSGGAIKLGNVLNDTRALSNDPSDFDERFLVSDNTIEDVGVEYKGAAAIFAGYVRSTNISHNSIRKTGYTAISLGWGWGTHVQGPQTFARANSVVGNRIESVMSALNDGGCVYTLGPQPSSQVSRNYCKQDNAPVVGCMYHDNGSEGFETSHNVCESTPAPCVYLQGCCNAPALNVHVDNMYCRDTADVRNGCAAENCTIDSSTLFMVPSGSPWPTEAQKVIDEAGPRSERV